MVFYSVGDMKPKRNLPLFRIPSVVCMFTFTLLIIYIQLHWAANAKREQGGYCEIQSEGLFLEPINTWSNLGFIIIGLVIAWQMMWGSFKENINVLTRSDFMSIFFSSLVIFLGPGSMLMHATYTRLGIELDVLSEYLVCAFLVAYSTQRFFHMGVKYFVGVFLLIIVICELVSRWNVYLPVIGGPANLLVIVFLALFIVTEILIVFVRHSNIKKRWAFAGFITLLVALVIWKFSDTGGPICYPRSWFQGHALWHLLDALALYFLFRYIISENNSDQSNVIANTF